MRKYRASLPPLDLLIFFEAAHRVGSFTGCASELHVSQAAVSKRIRQLEEWVGEPLFVRNGKRLLVTESGDRLYQTVGMALEFLRQGLGNLRENAARPLSIAANTVVGMFWLTSQLQSFGLSGDACPTRLTTSDNTNGLLDTQNDLLVIYSDGSIPGWHAARLLDEEMVPMASPSLAAMLAGDPEGSFSQYRNADCPPLLNYLRSAPDWVDWRVWFKALAMKGPDGWPVKTMSTYSQTIGEAIRGNGIALGSVALLHSELEAHRLVPLSRDVLRTQKGYYLCHNENLPLSGDAQRLAEFLVVAANAQRTGTGHLRDIMFDKAAQKV
ncbi:LysR family transcriptional regulator [Mesorhizobium sp. NPDC059054]|uniref:LysR family transcriptional regulator n=1 Tax=Mesorhizobium sp. NPDC059054 TaxID=3346711 RepID=UPI003680C060